MVVDISFNVFFNTRLCTYAKHILAYKYLFNQRLLTTCVNINAYSRVCVIHHTVVCVSHSKLP